MATLRYQFPYMEKGSRHPDRPAIAWATTRAAAMTAARLVPEAPLIAGGKSFGGRMTSQAQANSPLSGVRGLIFLGFPLHPAGRPSDVRADHLTNIRVPMLFIQGGRDRLADTRLTSAVMERLKGRATLEVIEGADHSFHLPARSGQTDRQALEQILDKVVTWTQRIRRDVA
ncbi:MAG: dienelactone hydrolase family protein [Acetobacteraceae bacterium]|nr:dienelactone hydrolase family protein [Acetobacteraceae bacterium]